MTSSRSRYKTLFANSGPQEDLYRKGAVLGSDVTVPITTPFDNGGYYERRCPHPHLHAVVAAGAWVDGEFVPWPAVVTSERLEAMFRRHVLAMLVREERLHEATAERLASWSHSGFSVFVGRSIEPDDEEARLRLARYLVKGPVSLERYEILLTYSRCGPRPFR